MRHDDVQRVGRAALKETDQHLAARVAERRGAARQILREHRATQKRRAEPHRHQRERAVLHEYASLHADSMLRPESRLRATLQ